MSQELNRFLTLFDGHFVSTNSWMVGTPDEKQG